jgi:hypothetical protein
MRKVYKKQIEKIKNLEPWLEIQALSKEHMSPRFYVSVNSWLTKAELKKMRDVLDLMIKEDK